MPLGYARLRLQKANLKKANLGNHNQRVNQMSWFSKKFKGKKEDDKVSQASGTSRWGLPTELSPEQEEQLLNRLVSRIKKSGLESVVAFYLEIYYPVTNWGSELALAFTPYVDAFGVNLSDYALLFRKKENVKKILERLRSPF